MAKVKVRERERETESMNNYEILYQQRNKFIEFQMTGKVVIHEKDREWEQSRQGRLKTFLHGNNFPDHCLRDWLVFTHDIRSHSGSHRHQGGLVIFCLEGKGYSVVDGARHDWQAGDLLLLPCKPGGVEHQHYNLEPGKPCKWIAFVYWPFMDMLGSGLEQSQISPDFKPR